MAFKLDGADNLDKMCWRLSDGQMFATITLAMNDGSTAAYETILLSEGEFSETVTFTQNNLTLVGQGQGKTTINGVIDMANKTGCIVRDFTSRSTSYAINNIGDDCKARNYTYTGNAGSPAACIVIEGDDVLLDNVVVLSPSVNAITIDARALGSPIDNVILKNCKLLNGVGTGPTGIEITVDTNDDARVLIEDCIISNFGGNGVKAEVYNSGIADVTVRRSVITKCLVGGGADLGAIAWDATGTGGTLRLTVYDNILTYSENGIYRNNSATNETIDIKNNIIYGNDSYEVRIDSGSLEVEYNWWGTDTPVAGQFSGTVDYTPWLTQPATSIHNSEILNTINSNVDQSLSTTESNIRGSDGDDLKDISDEVATNLTAIQSIQNNTRFTAAVPDEMPKPDTGNQAYLVLANLYDTDGNMEDPANNEILIRVRKPDGTYITANLYQENALTTPLANATDQANFPTASGWRAMKREGVGRYYFYYKVASNETEESLNMEFG